MEGSEGMAAMKRLMASFRKTPPKSLAGIDVRKMRDYSNATTTNADGSTSELAGPTGDLFIMDLVEDGNYVAARPSGTEPKIKLYMFTRLSQEDSTDVPAAREKLASRLKDLEKDLRSYADANC